MSEASIWQKLRSKGFSEKATAAIMGNMQQESAFRSNNVEDRYHRDTGKSDEYYTAAVDNGSYSRTDFMYDGGKSYGYGICQWTYFSRKAGLYDLAKSRGVSIADEQMQIDMLCQELQTDYRSVYNVLVSDASLYDMTAKFMRSFENPYDQSSRAINYRVGLAQAIYQEFAGSTPDPEPEPSPEPQPEPTPSTDSCEITARILKKGDKGRDVGMAQWALLDMEYDLGETGPNHDGVDGDFGKKTEDAVNSLKEAIGLATDGAIDEDVWQILFQ